MILTLTAVLSIALLATIVARPKIATGTSGGRILAFLAIFLLPAIAALMGAGQHVEQSKTTEFCTSCHVMEDYGKSLRIDDPRHLPAAHFQNSRVPQDSACFTCHTNYTMYGDFKAKLRGLRHVYVQYLGTVPKKIKLYSPYDNRECLHCHAAARTFVEEPTHHSEPGQLEKIRSNQLSCLSSGCHPMVHDVDHLEKAALWKEPSP